MPQGKLNFKKVKGKYVSSTGVRRGRSVQAAREMRLKRLATRRLAPARGGAGGGRRRPRSRSKVNKDFRDLAEAIEKAGHELKYYPLRLDPVSNDDYAVISPTASSTWSLALTPFQLGRGMGTSAGNHRIGDSITPIRFHMRNIKLELNDEYNWMRFVFLRPIYDNSTRKPATIAAGDLPPLFKEFTPEYKRGHYTVLYDSGPIKLDTKWYWYNDAGNAVRKSFATNTNEGRFPMKDIVFTNKQLGPMEWQPDTGSSVAADKRGGLQMWMISDSGTVGHPQLHAEYSYSFKDD